MMILRGETGVQQLKGLRRAAYFFDFFLILFFLKVFLFSSHVFFFFKKFLTLFHVLHFLHVSSLVCIFLSSFDFPFFHVSLFFQCFSFFGFFFYVPFFILSNYLFFHSFHLLLFFIFPDIFCNFIFSRFLFLSFSLFLGCSKFIASRFLTTFLINKMFEPSQESATLKLPFPFFLNLS